ncbi:CPBP family intramembrane glutamic endopeptidase [Leucobacter chromiireducens]|uniref:CPBP family intramembrane metalloprotease n=1 Tax=Leucobacter chromiireducens subsp. chromiireducens TaxID=660067 RepID=A0ABS1SS56_9MICO|nr:CPBP family intramembrane glutamic endopeptidase [Leucobacter chromiireducens]MBL3689766.1 CPBP family intramembrane metalloprotease [Leucobacter chromiireducens subsp. chromiireducens]
MHASASPAIRPWHVIAAALTVLAAPALFVFEDLPAGILLLILGLAAAAYADRGGCGGQCSIPIPRGAADRAALRALPPEARPPSLLRDLSLIALGLAIIRTIDLGARLDTWSMVQFTLALGGAVLVPYLVSRFLYRDRATGFPWRSRQRWGVFHWAWLAAVLVLGWLILPWYFISSGVYENWPAVTTPDLISRLFVGVGAVGIWDELFFICTVFAVLLRHFPAWLANVLQAVVFVSFLWELGYRSWGPLLTIPFALMQGMIFLRTRSLAYVVTVHLLFDAVVFAVLVHAHNPGLLDVFLTAP